MTENGDVEIRFGASIDDALAGIDDLRSALAGLTAPVGGIGSSLDQLKQKFAAAISPDLLGEARKGLQGLAAATQDLAAQASSADARHKIEAQGLAQDKILLDAEVNQFQITQNQKYALLQEETQKEYEAELVLLQNKLALQQLGSKQYQNISDKILELKAKHNTDMLRLDEQSIAQAQKEWMGFFSTITGAFNSNIRGLLEGTESWKKAFTKTLEDLVIKFIEFGEQILVKWLAIELAKTTASQTGAAARAAAENTSLGGTIAVRLADATSAILADAAQTFAGVFAFLSPTMGPAAAGPAAAAEASVSAAAIFAAGTDYVVRGGLALIHPGETIIPAARGSGPYSGAGSGSFSMGDLHIHPPAGQPVDGARLAQDFLREIRRKGVFAGNRLRR